MKRKLVDSNYLLEGKKIKTDLEPDFMNYISVPSLESIAIVNVATVLCKQADIRDRIRQHSLEFEPVGGSVRGNSHENSVYEIEKNILNKLSILPLHNLLKAKVSNIIRPIELQILEWMSHDRKDIEYIDSICWTIEGTIDKIKTLKQLIDKDTGQHIHSIYKLACMYCLEESIPNLCEKLPDKIKEDYLYSERIYKKYDNHLIAYWTSTINNKLPGLFSKIKSSDYKDIYNCNHSLYKNMFTLALSRGISLAVKYFWNKLTDVEISNNLALWVNYAVRRRKIHSGAYYQGINEYANILYFLLSKMNDKDQQGEVLQQNSAVILNSLFNDWPFERFLLPTIQRMWSFLDEKVYVTFLNSVINEIKEGKTTEHLFSGLWYDSPVNFKKYFIQHVLKDSHGTDVICNSLIVEGIRTIIAILDYANVEEHKEIIFSLLENNNLFKVIYAGRLDLFGILIEVLSESDINRIKERIVFKHGKKLCREWIYDDNWNMVDKFLNWAFTSQDQIDDFKNKGIDKIEMTYSLLLDQGNYELVNKFLSWCFDSEEEINQFKRYFAKSKPQIITIGYNEKWCTFEKFIDWCFNSEQEINDFQSDILQSYQIRENIFSCLAFRDYNFEYIDKLISWFCRSNEETKQYKTRFLFSDEWIRLLQKFVANYKVSESEWNNWELIKKFIKLFSPLEEDIITKLKEKIATKIEFDDFRGDYYRNCSYPIKKKDLFCLLDNDSYSVGDDESGTDSDYTGSDNDNDHDTSNYCAEDPSTVPQVLNDMLNRVESALLGENIL